MAKESAAISDRATVLYEKFGNVQPLPMIPIRTQEGKEYTPGIKKLQELIDNRIKKVNNDLSLEEVFKDEASLKKMCIMSGGHMRYLIFLMQTAITRTKNLPITEKAVLKAIALEPDNVESWTLRGTSMLLLGSVEDALKNFDKAVEIAPDYMNWMNQGSVLSILERYSEAIASFVDTSTA